MAAPGADALSGREEEGETSLQEAMASDSCPHSAVVAGKAAAAQPSLHSHHLQTTESRRQAPSPILG